MNHSRFFLPLLPLVTTLLSLSAAAQAPTVLGDAPADIRLRPLKDLNGYFPFQPPSTADQWKARRAELRFQVKLALGLVPEPTRSDLNTVMHGRRDMGDYSVEKVFFESMPGFYVTGSLYRPKESKGKIPAILCPHGHWANGRFYDAGEATARQQVEKGAESEVETARNPIQARCVHLARMGCVVFQYDMIGYADSVQISYDLAHRFASQRPGYNREEGWGFFSPQAERNLQSIMGLQTWNSIRALDFLESLEEVDTGRLAVTGASGGGTQTFLLAAVDDRIQLSFPAVMVSTAMQGGCTCENCSLLRITTGNVELAALFAPKPMGVTAADDWTREMKTKGYPQLRQLYRMLGAEENVHLVDRTEFKHNYNNISRTAMYRLVRQHFGLDTSTVEKPYRRLTSRELTVWNDRYPRPVEDPDFERRLLTWWKDDASKNLAEATTNATRQKPYLQKAFAALFQRPAPAAADIEYENVFKQDQGDFLVMGGPLRNLRQQEEVPVAFIHPKEWKGDVVVMTSEAGKNDLFQKNSQPSTMVAELVDQGISVVGLDLLFQGEFSPGKALEKTRKVENPREAAAYSFGYNHTLFARRTHDLLNLLTMLENHDRKPKRIFLVGRGKTGALLTAAAALMPQSVQGLVMEPQARDTFSANSIYSPWFMPGIDRFGGLPGLQKAGGRNAVRIDFSKPDATEKLLRLIGE